MSKLTYLIFFIIFLGPRIAAQVPNEPELYYLTVDPVTGNVLIVWLPIATPPDFDYYEVMEPVVLNPSQPIDYQSIATVYPPDTEFLITNTAASEHSVGYTVQAVRDHGGGLRDVSRFNLPDSTIFLDIQGEIDPCQPVITLVWNDYNNWRGNLDRYELYYRQDGGPWDRNAVIVSDNKTITRTWSPSPNTTYDFYVEAFHSDGIRSSKSNIFTINTGDISTGPETINADYATLGQDGGIDLSFTASSSGSFTYNLMRGTDPNGPFSNIHTFDNWPDSVIAFHDDIPFASGIYFYRLEVPNDCGGTVQQSNLANNILLNGTLDGMNVMLQWNEYNDWNGGVQQYTVTRYAGIDNPRVDLVGTGLSTGLNDDITSLVDYSDPLENRICYQVEATENPNLYGIQGTSTSNRICFAVNTGIRFPNAVIPNDPDNPFVPVFAFEPERYELIIYNRLGLKVWEGDNIGWDGTINGKNAPEGVYLYYFRIFNYSADVTELSGSVTVVYR